MKISETNQDCSVASDSESTTIDLKRMYWHSRRGMLELDLLLVPFATECLAKLDAAELDDYRALLQEEDQDLWTWLALREPAPSEALRRAIGLVLQHNEATGIR